MKLGAWAWDALTDILDATEDIAQARAAEDGEAESCAQQRWIAAHKVLVEVVADRRASEQVFGGKDFVLVDLHEPKSLRKRRNEQ